MQNLYEEVHGGRGGRGKIFHTSCFFSGGGRGEGRTKFEKVCLLIPSQKSIQILY